MPANRKTIISGQRPLMIASRCVVITVLLLFHTHLFSQDLTKKISLNLKDASLIDVINEISKAGGVTFSYSPELIPVTKKISIKAKNKSIKDILNEVFTKNGIDYSIVENQIILKPHKEISSTTAKPRAKNKFTLSGYIKDKTNDEILIGASIYAQGTSLGTISNAYGFYSLTLPEGTYNIVVSFVGYKSAEQSVELNKNTSLDTDLEESKLEIKAVEINATDQNAQLMNNQSSTMKLSQKMIHELPGFLGDVDIIKSLQAIPGFKSYGDGSTLFYVRGGNSDQNQILIDDVPIYNPTHLFGFFSALAPDAIKDVEAYKGDFPASFGSRLSSVLDIRTKDGNMIDPGFSGSVGPFTSNVTIEGPIKKDKSSFFVSARRANMNWLYKKNTAANNLKINFYDFNVKLNYKFSDNDRFFLTVYSGSDDFSRVATSTLHTFGISWGNLLGAIRWNHIFNEKLFSNTTIYSSGYHYYLYMSKEQSEYWTSTIADKTAKTDFTFYLNPKNTMKWGIELSHHTSNPGNLHFADNITQGQVPEVPKYASREFDLYFSNEQQISKKFSVRYGLRMPIWQNLGATTVYYFNTNYNVMDTLQIGEKSVYSTFVCPEPRVNFKFAINKTAAIKASYNRNDQFVQVLSNSVSPFNTLEVWVPSGPNIKPQKADQFALGYFTSAFKSRFDFSAEAYYKHFYNQIDYKDHANMLFNPLIEGELRFGKAWSYGAELMLRKQQGKLTGWVGYTYSRVFKQIEGVNNNATYPASYDRPHDINVNIAYSAGQRWSFSADWTYLTGNPISTPIGFYYYNGYSVPIYGEKNNDRLPAYHRLDLSATFKLNKPGRRYQHSLSFTVYNAYARRNPISINFNKILDDNGNIVVPADLGGKNDLIPTAVSVAGIIPSLTYNFKF